MKQQTTHSIDQESSGVSGVARIPRSEQSPKPGPCGSRSPEERGEPRRAHGAAAAAARNPRGRSPDGRAPTAAPRLPPPPVHAAPRSRPRPHIAAVRATALPEAPTDTKAGNETAPRAAARTARQGTAPPHRPRVPRPPRGRRPCPPPRPGPPRPYPRFRARSDSGHKRSGNNDIPAALLAAASPRPGRAPC